MGLEPGLRGVPCFGFPNYRLINLTTALFKEPYGECNESNKLIPLGTSNDLRVEIFAASKTWKPGIDEIIDHGGRILPSSEG